MSLRLVTPASGGLVTTDEAKAHLRVDHTDDDAYIAGLIDAATEWLNGENSWLNCSLLAQGWELRLKRFPCDKKLPLPKPPLIEVTGVFYTPSDGGSEVEITDYREIDAEMPSGGYILPAKRTCWPSTDCEPGSVRITFTTGYDEVPKSVKHAVLLMIGHWYEHRQGVNEITMTDMPLAVDALLFPYRFWPVTPAN